MLNVKRSFLAVSCALVLTACGGGDDAPIVITVPAVSTPTTGATTAPTTNATTTRPTTNTGTTATPTNTGTATTRPSTGATTPNTNTNRPSTPATPTGIDKAFSTALQQGFTGLRRGTYGGTTLTIDNNSKTVSVSANKNEKFEDFTLNGAKVLLLERVNDKLTYIPVRKLEADDFKSGFAPKDANNAGWIGSRFGNQSELANFGELRYGVYTDANNKTHLFVHGNPASRVFSGEYLGSAIIGKDGNYQGLPNAVRATVSNDLTKLDVSINTGSGNLNFGGNITGNTFSGTQNGVETKGGFFGEGLGGVFQVTEGTHKDKNGVFGASKKNTELSEVF